MIKLFQYPPASRSEIGKGVLVRMIPALLVLILSTIPLFIFIGKDSAANRDAVRKVTSQETEMAAAAVFIVFLLCVVYISIAAIKASAKHMRNFTCYAYYKGTLYSIGAAVPHSHSNTSNHGMRSIMKAQDDAFICAFGLASAAPRLPYRHLELCGITLSFCKPKIKSKIIIKQ